MKEDRFGIKRLKKGKRIKKEGLGKRAGGMRRRGGRVFGEGS